MLSYRQESLSGNWGIAIGILVVYMVLSIVIGFTFIGSLILAGVLAFRYAAAYLKARPYKKHEF